MSYDLEKAKLLLEPELLPDWQSGDYWLGLHPTTRDKPTAKINPDTYKIEVNGESAGYRVDKGGIVYASQRSGKGAAFIIPNIARFPENVLLVDPKGENIEQTWHIREARGQRVCVLDPFHVANIPDRLRVKFNPLADLDPESSTIVEDIAVVTDGLIRRTNPKDKHWDDGAATIIAGLIAHGLTLAGEGGVTLPDIRELLKKPKDEIAGVLKAMEQNTGARGLPRAAANAWANTGSEATHFMSSINENTRWLDSAPMEEMLSGSTFDLDELKYGLIDLVLVLPPRELSFHASFLRLFVRMALSTMLQTHRHPETGRVIEGRKCMFVLDEFHALGKLDEIMNSFGLLASHGVMLWPILQDMGQLTALYGEHAVRTFHNNSDVQMYFGINDFATAEYISKAIGKISFSDLNLAAPQREESLPAPRARLARGYEHIERLAEFESGLTDPQKLPVIGMAAAQARLVELRRDWGLEAIAAAQPLAPQMPRGDSKHILLEGILHSIAVAGYHATVNAAGRAKAELEARERQRQTDYVNAKAAVEDYENERQRLFALERAAWERGELQRHTDHVNRRERLEWEERERQTRFTNAEQDRKTEEQELRHDYEMAKLQFEDIERAINREFENRKALVSHAMHLLDKPRIPPDLVMKIVAKGPEDVIARGAIVFTPGRTSVVQLLPYFQDDVFDKLRLRALIMIGAQERIALEKAKPPPMRPAPQPAATIQFGGATYSFRSAGPADAPP